MKIFIGESFPFFIKNNKILYNAWNRKADIFHPPQCINLFIHYSGLSTKTLRQKTHEPLSESQCTLVTVTTAAHTCASCPFLAVLFNPYI